MNKSHMTAISRKAPSAPMKWLVSKFKTNGIGPILEYGCGKGKDKEYLNNCGFTVDGYDPHYEPNTIHSDAKDFYHVITCMFVMNVIESSSERDSTILHIKSLLSPKGHAYVAIRSDKAKLKGYTRKGTFQTYVDMIPYGFKLLHKGSGYELYEYIKI